MTVNSCDVFKMLAEKESVIRSLKNARVRSYFDVYFKSHVPTMFGLSRATALTPESGGIYVLDALNARGDAVVLYVGQTNNLHRRILEHYSVSSKDSAMKHKLKIFARKAKNPFSGGSEEELNRWMQTNVFVRCVEYKHHSLIEKYVINALNPLLNDDRGNLNLAALDIGFLSNAGLSNNKSLNPFMNSSTPLSRAGLFNNKDSLKPVTNSSARLLSGAGL